MANLTKGILTWPNALTLSRLGAAPFFCWALTRGEPELAALLFWAAVASDVADGRVARARGESSPLGGTLDHATDAIFVTLGLSALAARGIVPAALPIMVLAAFAQYALDSGRPGQGRLRGSALGRWNGVLYFVPPGVVATRDALGIALPADGWIRLLGIALIASTLASMVGRARFAWSTRRDATR